MSIHLLKVKQSWAGGDHQANNFVSATFQRTNFAEIARIARPELGAPREGTVLHCQSDFRGPWIFAYSTHLACF